MGTGNLRERPRRPRPSLRSRHCSRPPATWLTTQQPGPRSRRCCARWPYRLASITLMPWAVHAHPRLPLSMMPQTDKFASLHACIWRSCAAQVHSTSTGLPANWLRLTGQHVLQVCKCCSTRTYVTGAAGPCGTQPPPGRPRCCSRARTKSRRCCRSSCRRGPAQRPTMVRRERCDA